MKRQFAIGLSGGFAGALMVFVLIIIVGAAGAQWQSDSPARTTANTLAATITLSNTFTITAIGGDFAQFNSSWRKITQEQSP